MVTHRPANEQEAAAVIAAASGQRTPLGVTGGGTKAAAGRPVTHAATLSSKGLTGITLYEPAELVIAARAGTSLAEVERALADNGQELSFEPQDLRPLLGTEGEPTVGGLSAANLSGPRRIMAGACRDSLIGVRAINGRGEIVKSGGRVMKNVTGLDLVKLLAGSWGTLAFLTEVTFKVLPQPERRATLVLHGLDDERAIAALSAALGSPFEVSGAAHLPAVDGRNARTLLRTEGFAFSVDYRLKSLQALLKPFGGGEVLDDVAGAALWRDVRDVAPFMRSGDAVWRISTAPSRGAAIAAALSRSLDCRLIYDWGGGLIWVSVPAEGDAGAAAIRAVVSTPGDHATLLRAPAAIRATVAVFHPIAAPLMRLSQDIKQAFDPEGIFEPGRMYDGV
ncbi:glycolate oxidase subunit GlcE [Chelatococcus asaccharovorans]|uniref:glycolate oxidase subunit GlcE n=1 Tax=Chelatococcus asaccharovorans TaxID=28210 RepID=UPI00224C6F99|nr:glycolate oxidase subunit GlcE [Chelatococcus asaccharovorans]CAH1668819.1 Glycolate dehydrogenase, FAD-binding subunit GlcE [Chelatococcus asaccharovorans]CAH1679731.1 Glycolate dehydrogenase, FAD-binding subunit GlcE [Chelatococcus asaccharovorans]